MDYRAIVSFIEGRSDSVPEEIRGTPNLSAEDCLRIYRNDYQARMHSVLRSHYPATAKLLGETAFADLTMRYISLTPSLSWNIDAFGDRLADYLSYENEFCFRLDFPFLSELASIEWTSTQMFHESISIWPLRTPPQTMEDLSVLKLGRPLKVFQSEFQIPKIYRSLQAESSQPPKDWRTSSYYFLCLKEFTVQLEEINLAEFLVMKTWLEQGTLDAALSKIELEFNEKVGEIELILGPLLNRLHHLQLLTT